jgi:hypothetical protein
MDHAGDPSKTYSFNPEPAATADRPFKKTCRICRCENNKVMKGVKSAVAAGSGLNTIPFG